MKKVSDIMTAQVIQVAKDTPVAEMAKAMWENNLSGVPVVDGNKVIGLVTEADLVATESNLHMPTYIQILDSTIFLDDPEKLKEEMDKIAGKTAGDVMSGPVKTIREDADVHELATMMLDTHVNPVPVVNADDEIVGIVSRADLVKMVAYEE